MVGRAKNAAISLGRGAEALSRDIVSCVEKRSLRQLQNFVVRSASHCGEASTRTRLESSVQSDQDCAPQRDEQNPHTSF